MAKSLKGLDIIIAAGGKAPNRMPMSAKGMAMPFTKKGAKPAAKTAKTAKSAAKGTKC